MKRPFLLFLRGMKTATIDLFLGFAILFMAMTHETPLSAQYHNQIVWPYHHPPRLTQDWHGLNGWQGIDLSGGCGVELVAPISGIVTYNGLDGYLGPHSHGQQNTMLTIENGQTAVTLLHGHYDRVQVGDEIIAGKTVIGTEASIGNSLGCHTHFVVKMDGQPVNPLNVIVEKR